MADVSAAPLKHVLHDVIALLLLLLQVAYSYGREEKPAWPIAALHL
jgi:hypothetical protein